MPTLTPEPYSNSPSSVALLDLVKSYKNASGEEFITRWTNIRDLLGSTIEVQWGNILTTPTIDNQKDLLSLVSLRI